MSDDEACLTVLHESCGFASRERGARCHAQRNSARNYSGRCIASLPAPKPPLR